MGKLILANAIVWAGIILISAYLFKDSGNWKYFFVTVIFGFTITNGLISCKVAKNKKL
ncbi:MAG: hypothetical protein ACO3VF_06595 [Tamlana sp.]|jgi:hypothetical protein